MSAYTILRVSRRAALEAAGRLGLISLPDNEDLEIILDRALREALYNFMVCDVGEDLADDVLETLSRERASSPVSDLAHRIAEMPASEQNELYERLGVHRRD